MIGLSLGVASLFVLCLILVALVFSPRRYQREVKRIALNPSLRVRRYLFLIAGEWFLLIVVGIVVLLAAVPLATLGLRAPNYLFLNALDAPAYTSWLLTLFLIIAFWLLSFVGVIGAERRLQDPERAARILRSIKTTEMLPHTALERRLWFLVSISAGICEEILFRGFLPWYFLQIGNLLKFQISFPLALILSTLIFALAHAYQGLRGIVFTAVVGAVCTFFYIITDSLLLAIAYHILIDARLSWIAPIILRLQAQDAQRGE
jgi:membrane protease YdiL (CAAX protease family)